MNVKFPVRVIAAAAIVRARPNCQRLTAFAKNGEPISSRVKVQIPAGTEFLIEDEAEFARLVDTGFAYPAEESEASR